jgi:hypothetical protein
MTSTRFLVSFALVVGSMTAAVGCASPSHEEAAGSGEAITGVTDLSEMESALGLFRDTPDPTTHKYERTEAKLAAGPCYVKWMTGANAGQYELRRYTTGAAFFKKAGPGLAAGDERPVLCVDVDVDNGDNKGTTYTTAVSDIEIDAVLRYRLGAPTGGDGAAGTFYDDFQNGTVSTHGGYCPQSGFDPLAKDAMSTFCFGHVEFPGGKEMSGELQLLVYQYAYKNNKATNRYSFAADPVGRFISMEGDYSNQHVRFEHVDGHMTSNADDSVRTITITPKGSDASIAKSAIATCTISNTQDERYNVTCSGI